MMLLGAAATVALVLLNAGFAAVEVALARADPASFAGSRTRRGRSVARILDARGSQRSAAQVGVTLCSLGLGMLAAPVLGVALTGLVPGLGAADVTPAWAVAVALALTVLVQLVVGELVPKSVAAVRPTAVLVTLAGPYRMVAAVLAPLSTLLDALARGLARALRFAPSGELSDVRSREELRRVVARSGREGSISASDAELLDRALRLADRTAADALTPRTAVRSLQLDSTVGDLIDASTRTGLSRFPVHRGDLDEVVGVVHVKDVLSVDPGARRSEPLAGLVRTVLAVPESKLLEELLGELQAAEGQFAVVVDEYGGTAGIITLEDLLEELVGEIDDEHDPARTAPAVRRWRGAHLLSGRLHVDEVQGACGFVVPEGDYETLGGFVMARLGRIPVVGDRIEVSGWVLQVVEMDRRRVQTVRLVAPAPGAVDTGSAS